MVKIEKRKTISPMSMCGVFLRKYRKNNHIGKKSPQSVIGGTFNVCLKFKITPLTV